MYTLRRVLLGGGATVESPGTSMGNRVADHLTAHADAIANAWLTRLPTDPGWLEQGRGHVPDLLRDLADGLREDDDPERLGSARLDLVRTYVEAHRKAGHPAHRLVREFNLLSQLVCEAVDELLDPVPSEDLDEARGTERRIQRECGQMAEVATRLSQEAEIRERRRIADRLSDFARTLEHEIRGPLQSALTSAHLLEDRDGSQGSDGRREEAEALERNLVRVAELLTEARRLTMTEKSIAGPKWVPVGELILTVFSELEEMAGFRGVDLRVGELPYDALVRVPRVQLAVRNLMANAIKYSDPNKSDRFVEVGMRPASEAGYRLWVEDNGLGIPEGLRSDIFEPGMRAHPDVGSGAGLGLPIVREMLEQRRGSVAVESMPEGSRFVMDLPASLAVREH